MILLDANISTSQTDGGDGQRCALRDDRAENRLLAPKNKSQMILLGKEMNGHHGDANNVTDDGSPCAALDAPAEILDEHHVEQQVKCIVHQDGYRHQARTTINADHRVKAPHQQVGRCSYQRHPQVFVCGLIKLLVIT